METTRLIFPLIPVRNTVVFPTTSVFLVIGREKSIEALNMAQKSDGQVVIVAQLPGDDLEEVDTKKLYGLGTLCQVLKVTGTKKTGFQILVTGKNRFKIDETSIVDKHIETYGIIYSDILDESSKSKAFFNQLKNLSKEVLELLPGTDHSHHNLINQINRQDEMTYLAASYLKLEISQMQKLLEESDIQKKMKLTLDWLKKEKEVLLLEKDIKDKVGKSLTKTQRDALLREQLNALKKELGESDEIIHSDYIEKINQANMPEEVLKIAIEETDRLKNTHPSSSDHQVIRNYLDCLCKMPWTKSTDKKINLEKSEIILDKYHYGLEKIKKRILEYLAVSKRKGNLKGPVICLYGPPGVGKTSMGKSIAEALGKKFIRTSLGGVRDEAAIRGHRRTYVASMPGKIIQSIKNIGVNNPVILLDEIDKIGANFQGDPASAMLELLDPEQNCYFVDHYLDVEFDLSGVFFMATANRLDTIPAPLLDRMEIIELSSYTLDEKINIGQKFIIPKALSDNGLKKNEVIFEDELLITLIKHYTREPGVRDLRRVFSSLARGAAFEIVKGSKTPFHITNKKIIEFIGPHKYLDTQKMRNWTYGMATGLAWTPCGGEVLYLECLKMPGTGQLKLTGQLGDVMKESAHLALSFSKSIIPKIKPGFNFDKYDIHLHVPTGAIPKDGPSAGVGMLLVIMSIILENEVPQNLGITGEITLSGSVLPVGGIKEKIIACHKYGIRNVILPKQNENDLIDVPNEIKKDLTFMLIDSVDKIIIDVFGVDKEQLHIEHAPKDDFIIHTL